MRENAQAAPVCVSCLIVLSDGIWLEQVHQLPQNWINLLGSYQLVRKTSNMQLMLSALKFNPPGKTVSLNDALRLWHLESLTVR